MYDLTEEQLLEWQKCARSFEYFSINYIKIRSLKKGDIPFNLYDYQKRVLNDFEKHQFNIVKKFRQGGLTTLAVLWSLWICMFRSNKQILVMSTTDREAIKAAKILDRALDYIKETSPWLSPAMKTASKHVKGFLDTGCEIEFRTTKAARGQSLNYVIIDEAAFIANMDEAWAAMYPTVSGGGKVIVISTVNGMGNWYEEIYTDAVAGRNHFHVIELQYTEHPDYVDPDWIKKTKANLGKRKWAQEFEGSFLDSGETYLSSDILGRIDRQVLEVPIFKKKFPEWDTDERLRDVFNNESILDSQWEKGALWIWKPVEQNKEYIIGVDVAEGVGEDGDNSTFTILDSTNLEQVAEFSSNKIPTNILASILSEIGIYYNTALIATDAQGPGVAVTERLINGMYYENLYYRETKRNDRPGVSINKGTRPLILDSMKTHLQNESIKVHSIRLSRELKTFIFDRRSKKAQAKKGAHDDLVMAYAIAVYVRDQVTRQVPIGSSISETIENSHLLSIQEDIRKEIETIDDKDFLLTPDNEKEGWEIDDVLPAFMDTRPRNWIAKEFNW